MKNSHEVPYRVMETAAAWFEHQLQRHPARHRALDELSRFGLDADGETIGAFRIGHAPSDQAGLTTFLSRNGVSSPFAKDLRLIERGPDGAGHRDVFRHRLMFAVIDEQGLVVGFCGRALPALSKNDALVPRYVNSPERPTSKTGATIFGLWQAREAIKAAGHVIVLEANLDVLRLHARGIENVVAPLAPVFTREHARSLGRYTADVTLVFDSAGVSRRAAEEAKNICKEVGLRAEVVLLDRGDDLVERARRLGRRLQ